MRDNTLKLYECDILQVFIAFLKALELREEIATLLLGSAQPPLLTVGTIPEQVGIDYLWMGTNPTHLPHPSLASRNRNNPSLYPGCPKLSPGRGLS